MPSKETRPIVRAQSKHANPKTNRYSLFVRISIVALVLLVIGAIIFGYFLFGPKLLLYKDIGSDSLNDDYPTFVHLSDYIRTEGAPFWSFQVGLGQSIFSLTSLLLFNPVAWLPKAIIPEALVWQHLLKVLIVGFLFFRFLEFRGLNFRSSLAGALLLSFSVYMCFGSCWSVAANEVIGFTFLLFAVELAISRRLWVCLPFAVGLLGLLSVFHLYLCAILLCLYVPVRLVELCGWRLQPLWQTGSRLAAAAFLGVGLVGITAIDGTFAMLNSPRGSGPSSYVATLSSHAVFGFESSLHYVTAVFRLFSADMLGTGNDFHGWNNYFEAPAHYCGLLCLILLPQVFVRATRRQRVLYCIILGFLVVPIIFPWFRYLFWAFQGDYHRVFSLFSVFALVTLSVTALWQYLERKSFNPWLLAATLLVVLGVLWFPFNGMPSLIVPGIRKAAALFLIAYAALLLAGHIWKRQSIFTWLVLGLCASELIYFDRIVVGDRPTVTKQELQERVGYNDYTVDAIRDIKHDDQSFFRVTKFYSSGPAVYQSLNDAMIFGYFGSSEYTSFNNLNYIKFLMAVDVLSPSPSETDTRWVTGLLGDPLLSTFAGEKYILTKTPAPFQLDPNHDFLKRYGNIYLFRNNLFVPLGLSFSHFISEASFLELPTAAKKRALLEAVVLSEKDLALGLSPINVEELKQPFTSTTIVNVLADLRANGFNLRSFSQNCIEGTIHLDQDAVVVFQMPFDAGWRALANGMRVPLLRVDAGLLGIALKAGEHDLKLQFVPRFLFTGAVVTALSALILGFGLWRWPRIQSPMSCQDVFIERPARTR
jgi:uncharacterized membrane protein YfhO